MFDMLVNSWKVKQIRKQLYYILAILAIYRIGCHIGLPGISPEAVTGQMAGMQQGLFAIITGGGQGTVFAMGIGPYITSSIIMQLLTVAIPKLEALNKEGEEGRKKINQYTRYAAVALAIMQAIGTVYSLRTAFVHQNMFVYVAAVAVLVTGAMFIVWIAEFLTEKGLPNGSSFIIFSNILSSLPRSVTALYGAAISAGPWAFAVVLGVLIVFLGIIAFVIRVQDGERKIPVQYSKKMVGRQMVGGQSSYLPIKVNIAGVMSIIFAISLLQFPQTIYSFWQNATLEKMINWLEVSHPFGAGLYVVLIFCFTFFYTSFSINPIEMAENLKKNAGFIPGIRPGKPTSDYIQRTVTRLSWIGAVYYSIIAMAPVVLEWILLWVFGQKISIGFGGTTLLIVTGVALDLVKQFESQLLMRHHKGILS